MSDSVPLGGLGKTTSFNEVQTVSDLVERWFPVDIPILYSTSYSLEVDLINHDEVLKLRAAFASVIVSSIEISIVTSCPDPSISLDGLVLFGVLPAKAPALTSRDLVNKCRLPNLCGLSRQAQQSITATGITAGCEMNMAVVSLSTGHPKIVIAHTFSTQVPGKSDPVKYGICRSRAVVRVLCSGVGPGFAATL